MDLIENRTRAAIGLAITIAVVTFVGVRIHDVVDRDRPAPPEAAPVEVAEIERGPITLRRTFSGSLEALAEVDLAARVGGRVERVEVDVGDEVERGQLVAELEDDEYEQEVALARAELAVAKANMAEARSRAEVADRNLARSQALGESGIASESQLDAARTDREATAAVLRVAEAQVERAEAALAGARIRLGYTTVSANWLGGDDRRVVAERFVEPGDTVSANMPLAQIVEIDPIQAVVSVTERDYGLLVTGMDAELETDAYPGRRFAATTQRISPVFQETTRQARVELIAPNRDRALKPGMFVRATLELDRVADALIVPEAALVQRGGERGVFVVNEDEGRAVWRPVEVGVREGNRVQVTSTGDLRGRVVTLGQQLIRDGSRIVIPERAIPVAGPYE